MIKFSVMIPIFNGESFLEKAIKSVLAQDYKHYELILVNDGSTDQSLKLMEKYEKKDKRIRIYSKENTGIADTRNYAISKCKGDYFLFLDADDTINPSLLTKLAEEIERFPFLDLVKFQIQKIDKEEKDFKQTEIFSNVSGEDAFSKLILHDLFVTPVTYAYRREYFLKNKFSYSKGYVHEDFGLTPLVVIRAERVSAISYVGYNYFVRENSIMTDNSAFKLKEKNKAMFFHYEYLLHEIQEDKTISSQSKKVFLSYISNALVSRSCLLEKKMLKEYVKELKQRKIYHYFLSDTMPRKIKKIMFQFFPMLYIKIKCK